MQRDAGVPVGVRLVIEALVILGVLAADRARAAASARGHAESRRRRQHERGTVALFSNAGVRFATPLAYAALGELVVERAGVINIGLEGAIIGGAFGALVCRRCRQRVARVRRRRAGRYAGRGDVCVFCRDAANGSDHHRHGDEHAWPWPDGNAVSFDVRQLQARRSTHRRSRRSPFAGLSAIPFLGAALFDQPVVTYALYAIVPAMTWWFYRSTGGLALRAVGEHPDAALGGGDFTSAHAVGRILFGGAMGGIGGGTLVLAQVGTFAEGMSAGRGFIAIAIVVLGRWTPWGVAGAAFVFGAASSLQTLAQTTGWAMPYQLPLAFPYVLTLVLLASSRARAAAPAALGQQLG